MAREYLRPNAGNDQGNPERVVVIVVVLWIMNIFGLYHYINQFRVGQQ
jgi:hypothetical protein